MIGMTIGSIIGLSIYGYGMLSAGRFYELREKKMMWWSVGYAVIVGWVNFAVFAYRG